MLQRWGDRMTKTEGVTQRHFIRKYCFSYPTVVIVLHLGYHRVLHEAKLFRLWRLAEW